MRTAALAVILPALAVGAKQESLNLVPWTPAGISSPQFESHPAFDPPSKDFYFVRSSPGFEGWRILVSTCTPQESRDRDALRRPADGL